MVLPARIVLLRVRHLDGLVFVVHQDALDAVLLLLHNVEELLLLLDVGVGVARVFGVDHGAQLLSSPSFADLAQGSISGLSGLDLRDGELVRFTLPAGVLAVEVLELAVVDAPCGVKGGYG